MATMVAKGGEALLEITKRNLTHDAAHRLPTTISGFSRGLGAQSPPGTQKQGRKKPAAVTNEVSPVRHHRYTSGAPRYTWVAELAQPHRQRPPERIHQEAHGCGRGS